MEKMADDEDQSSKTEEPTDRKLQKLRDDGNVPKSKEVGSLFILLAMLVYMLVVAPWQMDMLMTFFAGSIQGAGSTQLPDSSTIGGAFFFHFEQFFLSMWPVLLIFIAFGYFGGVIQSGPIWTTKQMEPKLNKISLIKGFERLFSLKSWVEFLKSLLKITVIGAAVGMVIYAHINEIMLLADKSLMDILATIYYLIIYIIIAALAIMAVLAAIDVLYQKFEYTKEHRMSRKELKDEMKDSEGDPHIKARQRQIRMERARKRMMENVPKADVVITNPTHFAVALSYKPAAGEDAPRVVAKGADFIAARIREIATQNNVPLYEDPALARQLYYSVEIDDEIPLDLYEATAKVMAFIFQLRKKRA